MSIKVKICGMREPDNILDVGELQPDFMGFIFYPQSPRYVPDDFRLPASLPSSIKRVGVFVNEKHEKILNTVNNHALNFVQLHGNESVECCKELKQAGVGVIKVFSMGDSFDFSTTNSYKDDVDFFLFDTIGKFYGGNASAFDWNLLEQYDQEIPFFLSGGISLENIKDISKLSGMNLYAVDVNSSLEINPGVKNIDKVKELLKNLK